jgi:hypothetical protein
MSPQLSRKYREFYNVAFKDVTKKVLIRLATFEVTNKSADLFIAPARRQPGSHHLW